MGQRCGGEFGGHSIGDIGSGYGAVPGGGPQPPPWGDPHCSSGAHVFSAMPSSNPKRLLEKIGGCRIGVYQEGQAVDKISLISEPVTYEIKSQIQSLPTI